MKVHLLLTEATIIVDLKSADRDAILEDMSHFLKENNVVSQEQELSRNLIQRENLGSTAIGKGISIPHCKLKEVNSAVVAVAISKSGVDFGSKDKKPTHIFFLVVVSPENPSLNLQVLAAIAKLAKKSSSLAKRIMGATSPRRVIEIIREEEENLDE